MPSKSEDRPEPGPPLWSIGLAVLLMLVTPLLIYTMSPAGPIREGDTVFSDRADKAILANPLLYESARFDGTCLLDPQDPLMVIQRPSDRRDGLVLAKVQGKTRIEWPFCPPQAEILLTPHQIRQQLDVWAQVKARLVEWFN
ncbi:MAG TPA: hypothetical protein VIU63_08910 [Nitrospira sp.]